LIKAQSYFTVSIANYHYINHKEYRSNLHRKNYRLIYKILLNLKLSFDASFWPRILGTRIFGEFA